MDNITAAIKNKFPIHVPAWIAETYNPNALDKHYLADVEGDGFLLKELDLKSVNPYTIPFRKLAEYAGFTGDTVTVPGSLYDLYQWSCNNKVEVIANPGTAIAKLLKDDPNTQVPMSFGTPSTDVAMMCMVGADYTEFLEIAESYEKDSSNAIKAFRFIDRHPMYWVIEDTPLAPYRRRRNNAGLAKTIDTVDKPNQARIETGSGWRRVTVESYSDDQLAFETSGTPWHRETNFHDYALDVYAESMDAGLIKLAKVIHETYDLDGNLHNGQVMPNSGLESIAE